MPEGPEAHVMADDLNDFLTKNDDGSQVFLKKVKFKSSAKNFTKEIFNYHLLKKHKKLRLIKVFAEGKKVIFKFLDVDDLKFFIVCSLGMTGLWQVEKNPKNVKLCFYFDDKKIYFNDQLGWGRVEAFDKLKDSLKNVGPDLLSSDFDLELWMDILKNEKLQKYKIMDLLLEQKFFSGVGNYLRADALFLAGIDPQSKIDDLRKKDKKNLFLSLKKLMKKSYKKGGHSLRDYFRIDGSEGKYKPIIYSEKHCPNGHEIEKMKDKQKRTIHFCSSCQT